MAKPDFKASRAFWKRTHPNYPRLTKQQIEGELHDFHSLLTQVPLVYEEVTGGRLSKPNHFAVNVLTEYRRHLAEEIDAATEEIGEAARALIKAVKQGDFGTALEDLAQELERVLPEEPQ